MNLLFRISIGVVFIFGILLSANSILVSFGFFDDITFFGKYIMDGICISTFLLLLSIIPVIKSLVFDDDISL